MAMRRDSEVQPDLMMTWAEIPRSPGHVFYDRLQKLLQEGGFDHFVEETCKAYYAPRMGAPSVPPGRYFRMLLIGYFEGSKSQSNHVDSRAKCNRVRRSGSGVIFRFRQGEPEAGFGRRGIFWG